MGLSRARGEEVAPVLLLAGARGRVVRARPASAVVPSKEVLVAGKVRSCRARKRSRVARVAPRGPPRRVTSMPRRPEVVEVSSQRGGGGQVLSADLFEARSPWDVLSVVRVGLIAEERGPRKF